MRAGGKILTDARRTGEIPRRDGPIVLRPASRRDLRELMTIETVCFGDRQFGRDALEWVLDNPSAVTFVDDRGAIVGSVMVLFEGDECRILSVAVLPEWRRRGIGRGLMEAAERFARERGAMSMRLEVGTRNDVAIEFYRTLDYKIDGLLAGYYPDGEDAHEMRKRLGQANA